MTTFAYHRRRQLKGELPHGEECGREAPVPPLTLLPVRVVETSSGEAAWGFVLTLRNGRRIEAGWGFVDSELARLVRVAERE